VRADTFCPTTAIGDHLALSQGCRQLIDTVQTSFDNCVIIEWPYSVIVNSVCHYPELEDITLNTSLAPGHTYVGRVEWVKRCAVFVGEFQDILKPKHKIS
jgi:hypothetical protein